jgi:phosphoglucosamine mutase
VRFGTDGVRGVANVELTPEFVTVLGRAAARVLGPGPFLIGRDPRRSGTLLEAALAAGLCAEGCDVELLGVLPTPAVAWLSAADRRPAAMISASHNPAPDNGVKLFAAGGSKLSDQVEEQLEAEIERLSTAPPRDDLLSGGDVGVITSAGPDATHRYRDAAIAALGGRSLDGLSVVLDCANGASSYVAGDTFAALGATVVVLHADPDGLNINRDCGSTSPGDLADAVVEAGADVGFAFDGDADRVLAVDAGGRLIDGDQLIATLAIDLAGRGRLRDNAVVVTVMSNLGFRRGMAAAGIDVVETAVGDRYVLEALDRDGLSLGGEQSGHVIFRDLATTGDGMLSALMVADVMVRTGRTLADLADSSMRRLPQVLESVRLQSRPADLMDLLQPEIGAVEAELGDSGRVLVRPSGTEPVVRVMVEADDPDTAQKMTARLVAAVRSFAH